MKTFSQLYQELKESAPATFVDRHGTKISSIKHHDNDELAQFLQSDDGEGHMYIGKDEHGKPHSAKMTEETIPIHPIGSKVKINRPSHWAHGKIATVANHFGMGHHTLKIQGEYDFSLTGKNLKPHSADIHKIHEIEGSGGMDSHSILVRDKNGESVSGSDHSSRESAREQFYKLASDKKNHEVFMFNNQRDTVAYAKKGQILQHEGK